MRNGSVHDRMRRLTSPALYARIAATSALDWAEDHHDVELVDETGRRLARARLPEGLEGITRLHALIAAHMPDEWVDLDPAEAVAQVGRGSRPTVVRGCRLWWPPPIGCSRSIRCQ